MPTLKRCHIAATEAEYLAKLMQKHGSDCKVPYSHTTDRQMHNYTQTGMNTEIPHKTSIHMYTLNYNVRVQLIHVMCVHVDHCQCGF